MQGGCVQTIDNQPNETVGKPVAVSIITESTYFVTRKMTHYTSFSNLVTYQRRA